jgi:mannan endo-1,4-beta-mannosidase
MDYFVEVQGTDFVVNCKKFMLSGWNQWETVEAAAGALALFGASLPENVTGPQASTVPRFLVAPQAR